MQVSSAIVKGRQAGVVRSAVTGAGRSTISWAVQQFCRPGVLGFLSLAVMVGAWGYGYKLSQYLPHPVTRASATRMMVEHRNNTILVPPHRLVSPRKLRDELHFAVFSTDVPHLSRDLSLFIPAPLRPAFRVSSLIPFRAPPTPSSLA